MTILIDDNRTAVINDIKSAIEAAREIEAAIRDAEEYHEEFTKDGQKWHRAAVVISPSALINECIIKVVQYVRLDVEHKDLRHVIEWPEKFAEWWRIVPEDATVETFLPKELR